MKPSETKQVVLPAALVKNSLGFSIDMGASRTKFVHLDKDEDATEEAKVKVNLGWFKKEHTKELVDHIKSQGFHFSADDPPVLHTTGPLCHADIKDYMQSTLNVKVNNLMEVEGLIRGFILLSENLPMNEVVMPPCKDAVIAAERSRAAFEKMSREWDTIRGQDAGSSGPARDMNTMSAMDSPLPFCQAVPDLFPCIVGVYGTGSGCLKILADGKARLVDLDFPVAGNCLLGLAGVICGTSDYNELYELASKGDDGNVHQYVGDLIDLSERNDSYSLVPDTVMAHAFAKLVDTGTRGNARKEDLAKALVTFLAHILTHQIYWYARASDCKRVFLAGGMFEHPMIRYHLTTEFLSTNYYRASDTEGIELYFISNPEYIMVMGTLFAGAEYRKKQLEK